MVHSMVQLLLHGLYLYNQMICSGIMRNIVKYVRGVFISCDSFLEGLYRYLIFALTYYNTEYLDYTLIESI